MLYIKLLIEREKNIGQSAPECPFKKFWKVGDVGFSANVFGESVPCGRSSVRKGTLAELGAKSR